MSKHVAQATSSAVWGLAIGLTLSFTSTRTLAQAPTAPAQTPPAKAAVESISTFSTPTLSAAAATTTEVVSKQPTPEIQKILKELETKHAGLKTVQAEFGQVKVWQDFSEKKTRGKLFIEQSNAEQAGRLRYDMEGEKGENSIVPSTTLFVDNTIFDYTPINRQVDKCVLDAEGAREQFRMLLLGFGLSSKEILNNYNVEKAGDVPEVAKTPKPLTGLSFTPVKDNIRQVYANVSVWLEHDTLWPYCIRIEEVSGDVRTITIRSLKFNEPIQAALFEPKWPKNVKVIDFSEQ
jgi:outer membrane lipoprotein-sorting protein